MSTLDKLSPEALDLLKHFDYTPKPDHKPPYHRVPSIDTWKTCVILGPSGTGKTTSLRRFGDPSDVQVDPEMPAIELGKMFGKTVDETITMYRKCGFGSVPSWVLPYKQLSNGEKYRVQIALKLMRGDNPIILDEFGSYIDHPSAVMLATLVRKLANKTDQKFLIATLNPVIAEELEPDELIELGTPSIRRSLRRDRILQVQRVHRNAWEIFKHHHYMSSNLISSAKCFLFTMDGNIVGFNALKPFPHGFIKNAYNGHRTVVLPTYQGFGLGPKIADITASIAAAHGYTVYTKTVHPSLGEYRTKSPLWRETAMNGKEGYSTKQTNLADAKFNRKSYTHAYVGPPAEGDMAKLWYEPLFDRVDKEELKVEKKIRLTSSGLFEFLN